MKYHLWIFAFTLWGLGVPLASVAQGDPDWETRGEIGPDVWVDWTSMSIQARGTARNSGTQSRKAVENTARKQIGERIERHCGSIRIGSGLRLRDLLGDPIIGEAIRERVASWMTREARYEKDGRVSLLGHLELSDLLRPYTLMKAKSGQPLDRRSNFTGVFLDARGMKVKFAWMPGILGPDGELLHDGTMWNEYAPNANPVVYVSNEDNKASEVAGLNPLRIRGVGIRGTDIMVNHEDALRFQTVMTDSQSLGSGALVILVDP